MDSIDWLATGLPPEYAFSLDRKKFDTLQRGALSCELCNKEMASRMITNSDYGSKWVFLGEDCYRRYKADRTDRAEDIKR